MACPATLRVVQLLMTVRGNVGTGAVRRCVVFVDILSVTHAVFWSCLLRHFRSYLMLKRARCESPRPWELFGYEVERSAVDIAIRGLITRAIQSWLRSAAVIAVSGGSGTLAEVPLGVCGEERFGRRAC